MAFQALESILRSAPPGVRVIVSDNSTNASVEQALLSFKERGLYRRREKSFKALDHFNQVISEVQSDYFMMFHDDDIMMEDCIQNFNLAIAKYPQAVAIAMNAVKMKGEELKGPWHNSQLKDDFILKSFDELAEMYLDFRKEINPFPGYLYKNLGAQSPRISHRNGRKYADVAFVLNYIQRGPIVWLKNPGLYYRQHENNDSNVIDLKGVVLLSKFIQSRAQAKRIEKFILEFKFGSVFAWWRQNMNRTFTKRERTLFFAMLKYLVSHPRFVFDKVMAQLK